MGSTVVSSQTVSLHLHAPRAPSPAALHQLMAKPTHRLPATCDTAKNLSSLLYPLQKLSYFWLRTDDVQYDTLPEGSQSFYITHGPLSLQEAANKQPTTKTLSSAWMLRPTCHHA